MDKDFWEEYCTFIPPLKNEGIRLIDEPHYAPLMLIVDKRSERQLKKNISIYLNDLVKPSLKDVIAEKEGVFVEPYNQIKDGGEITIRRALDADIGNFKIDKNKVATENGVRTLYRFETAVQFYRKSSHFSSETSIYSFDKKLDLEQKFETPLRLLGTYLITLESKEYIEMPHICVGKNTLEEVFNEYFRDKVSETASEQRANGVVIGDMSIHHWDIPVMQNDGPKTTFALPFSLVY